MNLAATLPPPTNSYEPTHGKPIVAVSPEKWDDEFSNVLFRDRPLRQEYAPAAPASYRASMSEPANGDLSYSVRAADMLPEVAVSKFGPFEEAPHSLTFTSAKKCCGTTSYEFAVDEKPFLKGENTLMKNFSNLCWPVECLGWLEPFNRRWEMKNMSDAPVFSFEIQPGWLDSQVHRVLDYDNKEIGRIQQPSFVQRMSDMWRTQMQVVVRVVDSKGYDRFTLRRRGGCHIPQCPYMKKFLPDPSDMCYGRWNMNLGQWVDCDFSKYDCGNCNNQCGQASNQPCYKCISCRQCCEYRECDVCFENPGTVCCECDWYHCDICGADQLKCPACPLCQPCCGQPGNGCCDARAQDCAFCHKPCCDVYATCFKCNCLRGCEFKCCVNNFACCKFTECGKNWGLWCKLQCTECFRPCHDCPACGVKCKTFYSKCGPQCKRECEALKVACTKILPCIKNCITRCPRRCKQLYCGGREVRIQLDVFGPDGDNNEPVSKIVYTGVSGWCCGVATLRPKYVCTIEVPQVSPYYARWKSPRACDYVDLALLTSLAMWYDFFTVAPREWFQCVDPLVLEGNEKWPENAYHEWHVKVPLLGEPNYKEPEPVMIFKWLYGEDFAFLLDPMLFINRFQFIQENPAGTLPPKEKLPTNKELSVQPQA